MQNRTAAPGIQYDVEDAYAIIAEWFTSCDLATARDDLDRWFDAAIADSYAWADGPPSYCLLIHDKVLALIGAAHVLRLAVEAKDMEETGEQEIVLPKITTYISFPDEYPRLLSADEWRDPISALARFFRFQEYDDWIEELHLWLDAGLSDISITETIDLSGMLHFCRHLHRLLEACYVIKIQREESGTVLDEDGDLIHEPFSSVNVLGRCKIRLTKGEEQSIKFEGKCPGAIKYEVLNGVLNVTGRECCPMLLIQYKELTGVDVNNLAEVEMTGPCVESHLKVTALGTGLISGEMIDTDRLEIYVGQHARIALSGKAGTMEAKGRDEGRGCFSGLTVDLATVYIGGASKMDVNVSHVLTYQKSEGGELNYAGEPVKKIKDLLTDRWTCIFNKPA